MKKYMFSFLLSGLLLVDSIAVRATSHGASKAHCVGFAFDYHGVIVKKPVKKMIKQALAIYGDAENKWQLTGALCNPLFWYNCYKTKKRVDITDVMLKDLAEQYPALAPHVDKVLDMINMHEPIEGMPELLQELEDNGFDIYLASNIGSYSIDIAKERQPELYKYFGNRTYTPGREAETRKPHKAYFVGLREKYNKEIPSGNDKQLIFIDDRKENVVAAQNSEQNIEGIHFTSTEQLRNELRSRGILH